MGLQYLIIGCFFLLNPYFSIIDILPDFIGCIFLLKGLSKVSKISASFEDAYKQFGYLLAVSAVRMICIPLITNTQEIWPLIVVLCAGLIEAFFSIRGFQSLFDGLSATAHAPESALFTRWQETRQITYIFLIAKQVICVLPELCLLSSGEYGVVTPDGIQSAANYRMPLLLLSMIIGLFFGIAWFVQIRRYLKKILLDQPYLQHLEDRYRHQYASVSAVYIADQLRIAVILLMAAVVLSLELIFDGVNYLPHFIGAIFFAVGSAKLASLPEKSANSAGKKTARLALLYGIISIPRFVYSIIFSNRIFGEYLDSKEEGLQIAYSDVLVDYLQRDFTTIYGFIALIVMAFAEAVCFILLLRSFCKMVKELIQKHTRASIPAPPPPEGMEQYTRKKDDFALSLNSPLALSRILGILTALSMVFATAAVAIFPSYWLIDAIIRVAWVISAYYLLSKLKDEIASHYSYLTREEDLHALTR